MRRLITQPQGQRRLGDVLLEHLRREDQPWLTFETAVAFVKASGVAHLFQSLRRFAERGGRAIVTVGVDLRGSSIEGLQALLQAVGDGGEVWVHHNEAASTFHPKLFVFGRDQRALLIVGSGNLTEGGLFTNDEAAIEVELDLAARDDLALYRDAERALRAWRDPDTGMARRLDAGFLGELTDYGYVVPEAQARGTDGEDVDTAQHGHRGGIFRAVVPPAPPRIRRGVRVHLPLAAGEPEQPRGFVMTLQQTDAGTGQVTAGTSRRSPEIFIPLAARAHRPGFWQWPNAFTEDPEKEGKYDRHAVRMRIAGQVVLVNMMTWPDKHDFRLRAEALRSAGQVGDILRVESATGDQNFDYYVEIIPRGTVDYADYLALCSHPVRNSQKRWGYY